MRLLALEYGAGNQKEKKKRKEVIDMTCRFGLDRRISRQENYWICSRINGNHIYFLFLASIV